MEQILLDCEKAKQFCEYIQKCHPCLSDRNPELASSDDEAAEASPYGGPATVEEIENNYTHAEYINIPADVLDRVPALAEKSPEKALELLITRYQDDRSVRNAILLEDAINRLTLSGPVDAPSEESVTRGVGLLLESSADADGIQCRVYEHKDFKGRSAVFDEYHGIIYKTVSELRSVALNDKISSLWVAASADEVGGSVIVFEHDRYFGRYARFDATPGSTANVPYVGGFMNDRTSSILIVRRFWDEMSVFLSDLVSHDSIKAAVAKQPHIKLRGEPILTWDMWPTGSGGHPNSPKKAYIYVRIPIVAIVDHWFDYDAEIRFWVYLYVDSSGALQGYVDYYGEWVEDGIIHDSVRDELMKKIPKSIPEVNKLLADGLAFAKLFQPFSLVYLLPGRFDQHGNTDDDVTVVVGRRTDSPIGPLF
jgi:hypothetical protein